MRTLLYGLQVTNLTDRVPWGSWITHDLSAIAYLLKFTQSKGIARAAVFVGFIGYTSAMLALVMDIGRPDRFWHPWNVTLSGLVVPPQWSPGVLGGLIATPYFPSPTEMAVSIGVLRYAFLAFTLGVRHLPLYPRSDVKER